MLQNNALRICLRYKLADRVSEQKLHVEAKLQSLEQRRKYQLLKLMYYHSKNAKNIKIANRHTRAADKVVFNVPTKCSTKYLKSAYYIGTQTWNSLSGNTQRSETLLQFEKSVSPLYKVYQEPMNL